MHLDSLKELAVKIIEIDKATASDLEQEIAILKVRFNPCELLVTDGLAEM